MMSDEELQMHLRMGEASGRDATCGKKVDYRREEAAVLAARVMTGKHGRDLEGYPCFWCHGWHIGRMMTKEEREQWSSSVS